MVVTVITFFKLRHEKIPELELEQQTTPKCCHSQLLARLDAINPNTSTSSMMDESSESGMSGLAVHGQLLPEGLQRRSPRVDFLDVGAALDPTMYSSTPITHSGLNLRRTRIQTPNSPM